MPPSEPVASFEKFERVLQYLENEDKEIIFLGDINYDLDPFASSYGDQRAMYCEKSSANKSLELCNAYGLKHLINQPTRETLNTSTLIDHVSSKRS